MTVPKHRPIRVRCGTRGKTGRAAFNEVALGNAAPPRGVLLIAIVPDEGLRLWLKSFATLEPHTKEQHGAYSRSLTVNVDNPPDYLGEAVLVGETMSKRARKASGSRS